VRIVQVVENLEVGGLERLAVDLALAEKRAGHTVSIFCLTRPGALAVEAEAAGVPVVAFQKKGGPSIPTVWRMAQRLRGDKIDVVHTHNPMIHHYGVAASRLARVPVVVNTRHGLNLVPHDSKVERIFKATMPWTDQVVVVSEHAREFFLTVRGLPRAKTRVILNGIPVEKFGARRASPGTSRPCIRFGTVARMVPAKDHATLVDAFALVVKRFPQAELHFLGDGPARAALDEQVASLGLQRQVKMNGLGFQVAAFLASLDVFVLSSLTEGLPVSILEAMAAGLPIVSTRVGGVPEVAPEGRVAWYAPAGLPGPLSDAMMQAAADPGLAARGEEAWRLAQAFSMARMCDQYIALFQELLARR
jgi:glycosyltransferase involved in cell wall biosynthesis